LGITLGHGGKKAEFTSGSPGVGEEVMETERVSKPIEGYPVILGGYKKIKEDVKAAKQDKMGEEATIGKFPQHDKII
jgi:hypothetical protein